MSVYRNNVANAVTSVAGSGLGAFTLGSAVAGAQSFATAYGANATVDIFVTEGTAWEVARDCAYTHSGTTLGRGTFEASSTGAAVAFTSAAVVRVSASANTVQQLALDQVTVTGTSGAISAEVNKLYVADMSDWTANRTLTLPAVAAVGDRVRVIVTTGSATRAVLLTAAAGDTLNGVAGGTEWSRLFITGETLTFVCTAANAAWAVEVDGRIPCFCSTVRNATKNLDSNVETLIEIDTLVSELPSGLANTTLGRITIRRTGRYVVTAAGIYNLASGSANTQIYFRVNTVKAGLTALIPTSASGLPGIVNTTPWQFTAGDFLELGGRQGSAATAPTLGGSERLIISEVL
jgi:hypothetical protein